jgi:Spy/CpxP family protein refolding chaperone
MRNITLTLAALAAAVFAFAAIPASAEDAVVIKSDHPHHYHHWHHRHHHHEGAAVIIKKD